MNKTFKQHTRHDAEEILRETKALIHRPERDRLKAWLEKVDALVEDVSQDLPKRQIDITTMHVRGPLASGKDLNDGTTKHDLKQTSEALTGFLKEYLFQPTTVQREQLKLCVRAILHCEPKAKNVRGLESILLLVEIQTMIS